MDKRTSFPNIGDYTDLKIYKNVILNHFGITRISDLYLYYIWYGMIDRCYNPKNESYHRYGGRGIAVCDRWRENVLYFISDVGPRPTDEEHSSGLSIWSLDRIDNNGNYEPNNWRWATAIEQARNREIGSDLYEYEGRIYSKRQLAEIFGLSETTMYRRLNSGMSMEDAINPIMHGHTLYEYRDNFYTQKELSNLTGTTRHTIRRGLDKGLSLETALNPFNYEIKQYEYQGGLYTVSELSELRGIDQGTLRNRLRSGMNIHEALDTPVQSRDSSSVTYQNISLTLAEWDRGTGPHSVAHSALYNRRKQGLSPNEILRPDRVSLMKKLGVTPDIVILSGDIPHNYDDIIHCTEVTGMLLLDVIAGLNDPNSNIMYLMHYLQKKDCNKLNNTKDMKMKNLYENDNMSVETDEVDTVVVINKATEAITTIQVIEEGFNMVYSEGDEDLQNIDIAQGGNVNVSSVTTTDTEEDEAA